MTNVEKAFKTEINSVGLGSEQNPRLVDYAIIRDKEDDGNSLLLLTYDYDSKVKNLPTATTRRFALYQGEKEYAIVSGIVETWLDKKRKTQ